MKFCFTCWLLVMILSVGTVKLIYDHVNAEPQVKEQVAPAPHPDDYDDISNNPLFSWRKRK